MRALQAGKYGDASEVVNLVELAEPGQPVSGEVQIEVEFSPVGHNDFLMIAGRLPNLPKEPPVLGNEGVGRVRAIGPDVSHLKVGDRVFLPIYGGAWRERLNAPAEKLFALPTDVDPRQLSMLRINPSAAALLLSEYVDLKPREWVIQNASNSAVGRAVIAVARERGLKTINLVRREDLVQELVEAGGDLVLLDSPENAARAADILGDRRVPLAIDGVGGPATERLIAYLAPRGKVVSYAMMSKERPIADLGKLMNKGVALDSFYLAKKDNAPAMEAFLPIGVRLLSSGSLVMPVSAVYPLKDFKEAFAHTLRGGKVLLEVTA